MNSIRDPVTKCSSGLKCRHRLNVNRLFKAGNHTNLSLYPNIIMLVILWNRFIRLVLQQFVESLYTGSSSVLMAMSHRNILWESHWKLQT